MSRLLLKAVTIYKALIKTTNPTKRCDLQEYLEQVLDALEPDDFDEFHQITNY